MLRLLLFCFGGFTMVSLAQTPPRAMVSPEVHPDGSVTFRFLAPGAGQVVLAREGAQPEKMEKGADGVWSITTSPLPPDYYGYAFVQDGVHLIDPLNVLLKPNLLNLQSVVHVPGPASLPWETSDVPRGEVHHHFYRSQVVGDQRDFFVYTPPGYDTHRETRYPTLYLFHGYSDDAGGWTAVGRANVILDNLIAQGKVKPMVVVMPLGYGAPEIVRRDRPPLSDPQLRNRNYERFRDALFQEVMPIVNRSYRTIDDRRSRAIAGLSMGGTESLYVGLNATDRFAYVGSFSAGGLPEDFDGTFPDLSGQAAGRLRLLWVACGTEDHLIDLNRKFRAWLQSKGIQHVDIETPGAHTWMVWRRNLAAFAPLLFTGDDSNQGGPTKTAGR